MNKQKLTREKKNNLIAKSQGWVLKWCNRAGCPLLDVKPRGHSWEVWLPPKNSYEKHPEYFEDDAYPPDYFNDLNAIHEAEKVLGDYVVIYHDFLCAIDTEDALNIADFSWHANAAQRAEAFGLTMGLWDAGQ